MRTGRLLLPLAFGVCAVLAATPWGFVGGKLAWADVRNPKGVALIIGNGDYEHRDVPDVRYAHRDAEAFKRYVLEVLGFAPDNVIDLRDATRRAMHDALGTRRDIRSDLWSYLDPEGGSEVVVFYSGHGVPGEKDKRGYLLPVDADPKAAEQDGYPIDLLYSNLGRLTEAKTVRVYVDACFSGGSHEGGLIRDASPVYVQAALPSGTGGKVTSLTAATGKQIASWDADVQHGLFTHHLLDALYGKADANRDGRVTAKEAKVYLDRWMTRAARRKHRRIQQATLMGTEEAVLTASPEGKIFPERGKLEWPAKDQPRGRVSEERQVGTAAEVTQQVRKPIEDAPSRPSQWQHGQVFRDCSACPQMVVVPPGTFMKGSPVNQPDRFQDETPYHQVMIPEAFAVGKYEVTLSEWDACVSAGGCGGYRPSHWGSVRNKSRDRCKLARCESLCGVVVDDCRKEIPAIVRSQNGSTPREPARPDGSTSVGGVETR